MVNYSLAFGEFLNEDQSRRSMSTDHKESIDGVISPDDLRYSERERALIRVGLEGIGPGDEAKLNAYFADGYVFHGPDGGKMTFEELKAFFATMRKAFRNYACERHELVSRGEFITARTVMSGIFESPFESPLVGTVKPTGRPMTLELLNFFRYNPDGRLAEEWVQYDNVRFHRELGVNFVEAYLKDRE